MVISEPILEEIAEVLTRPRIKGKYGILEADIKELLILIEERAEHVLLSGDILSVVIAMIIASLKQQSRDKQHFLLLETMILSTAKKFPLSCYHTEYVSFQ